MKYNIKNWEGNKIILKNRVVRFLKRLPANCGVITVKGREYLVEKVHTGSGSTYCKMVVGAWRIPKTRKRGK